MKYSIKYQPYSRYKSAFTLVMKTFESLQYGDEGTETFRNYLYGEEIKDKYEQGKFLLWKCTYFGKCIGVIAVRDYSHITLLFVDKAYQRKGIGTALMNTAVDFIKNRYTVEEITVNSSLYGVPFYKAYGFVETGMEEISDGINYVPMKLCVI